MTNDNRINTSVNMGLIEILEDKQRENGVVIHNSFLESLEEDKIERILRRDIDKDCFNYMIY